MVEAAVTTEAYALTIDRRIDVIDVLCGDDQAEIDRICQWYDYQANHQNRHKCWHEVKLLDGVELDGHYYPNADSWARMKGTGPERLHDDQVGWVRVSRKQWEF